MTPRKLIKRYSINQSVHWFMFGLIIPVLMLLQLEKGLNYFQIGITMALYSGMTVLLELPTGGLADSIGRKRIYQISLVVTFFSGLIVLFAQTFLGIAFGFAVMGAGRALSSGSLDAWFVDEFYRIEDRNKLPSALAKVGFFIPLGLGAGCLIGGWLPMSLGEITSGIEGFTKYSANLLAINVMVLIQFVLTSVLIKEERQENPSLSALQGFRQFPVIVKTSISYGIKNKTIFLLLISTLAWGFSISGLELLWQPRVKHIALIESQTWVFGALATGYFLASSMGNLIIAKLCTLYKNSYTTILFYTRLTMGLLLMILAFQNSIAGFTFFYWTLFIFNGMTNPPHAALFNSLVPSKKRSTLLSFESLFLQFGGLSGSLIMGYISNHNSIPMAWIFGACILILSSLAYVMIPERQEKNVSSSISEYET